MQPGRQESPHFVHDASLLVGHGMVEPVSLDDEDLIELDGGAEGWRSDKFGTVGILETPDQQQPLGMNFECTRVERRI